MNRMIILLMLSFIIASCSINDNKSKINENEGEGMSIPDTTINNDDGITTSATDQGRFEGVVLDYSIDLEDAAGSYSSFVVDEKLALDIGNAVLVHIFGDTILSDTYFVVREIADRGFIVVTRIPNSDVPGEDYSVAINKEDGRILRIWMGE